MKPHISSISVTEQIDYASCRRYWLWSNYGTADGSGYYVSKSPQMNMWLGGGVHQGMEAYYRSNRDPERMLGVYDDWYTKFVTDTRREYSWVWDSLQIECQSMYDLGRGMLINYHAFEMSGQSQLRGIVDRVEKKRRIPILEPTTRKPTRKKLVGKIDLVMKDGTDLWIVDHKTAASAPQSGGIDVDEQLTAYIYIYWRVYGEIPTGAIYNVLLKSLPEPPNQLLPTKKEPILFSRAKSQNTVYEVYLKTLQEAGVDLAPYADALDHFRTIGWSKHFIQQEVTRNESELLAYEKRLYYRSLEMSQSLLHPEEYAYPSPSTFGCGRCAFLAPCKAKDSGEDYESLLDSLFVKKGETS